MGMSSVRTNHTSSPQLRESCDACNIAKVKCSKKQPRCKRCDNKNKCCTYSVSLRSVSKKRHYGDNLQAGHAVDLTKSCIVDGKPVESNLVPNPGQNTITPPTSDGGDMDWFDPTFNGSWANGLQNVNAQGLHSFAQSGVDFDALRYSSTPMTDVSMGFAVPSAPTGMLGQSSSMTPEPSSAMFSTSGPTSTCACYHTVLPLLTQLSSTIKTSYAFDQGLATNKIILSVCTSAIQCCDQEMHTHDTSLLLHLTALLHHGISIFDVLAQARAERQAQSSSTYFASTSYGSTHAYASPSPEITQWDSQVPSNQAASAAWPNSGGRRRSVRLMLGSYQLDREDEDVLQGNLIGIELGKIDRVLDALGRCFAGEDAELAQGLLLYLHRRLQSYKQCV